MCIGGIDLLGYWEISVTGGSMTCSEKWTGLASGSCGRLGEVGVVIVLVEFVSCSVGIVSGSVVALIDLDGFTESGTSME